MTVQYVHCALHHVVHSSNKRETVICPPFLLKLVVWWRLATSGR